MDVMSPEYRKKLLEGIMGQEFCDCKEKPISVSFAGCGFNGLYHLGVASCLREYMPLRPDTIVCGASAGALAALALCLRLPLGESTSEILGVALKGRRRALGPFHPSFDVNRIIFEGLKRTLPEDAHLRASGRLIISMTRVRDGKNILVNQYDTKEDLIKAIQCSCFIPFWSGVFPPKFHGTSYMDGGLSDNLPRVDHSTITVSPFSGEADICPRDETYNPIQINIGNTSMSWSSDNMYRLMRILFPAHPEKLANICQQGFDDALRFLQRNNKIACIRCLAIQSSFSLEDDVEEDSDYASVSDTGYEALEEHPRPLQSIDCKDCSDCQDRRRVAKFEQLPDSVAQAIQEACDAVNKGIINWLFRTRPMKILSFLSIPYLLPIDITIAMIVKVWRHMPEIKAHLKSSLFNLLVLLRSFVSRMDSKRHQYSAKFSCQLAVTEYDYTNEQVPKVYDGAPARKVSCQAPRRVIADPLTKTVTPGPSARRIVGKSQSFNAGNSIARKRSTVSFETPADNTQEMIALKAKQRLDRLQQQSKVRQRKSYAGFHDLRRNFLTEADRRKSMIDLIPKVKPTERLISKVNFGFSVDFKSKSTEELQKAAELESELPSALREAPEDEKNDEVVIDALRRLEDIDQTNAIEIANRALEWEREWLDKYKEFGSMDCAMDGTNVTELIELTKKQEALMAFYYTDENNRVKVTEIFKCPEEDAREAFQTAKSVEEELRELSAPEPKHKQVVDDDVFQTDDDDGLRTTPPHQRRRKESVILID